MGKKTVAKLIKAGFDTVKKLANADVDDITEIPRVGDKKAEKFKKGAQDAIKAYNEAIETNGGQTEQNQTTKGAKEGLAIQIHSGGDTIGGAAISIVPQDPAKRGVILEFGLDFDVERMYLDRFLFPRSSRALLDETFLGQIPIPSGNLAGIYREDYQKQIADAGTVGLVDSFEVLEGDEQQGANVVGGRPAGILDLFFQDHVQ